MPVSYWIGESGLSQISNGSEFQAVHAAFQTWQNVQTADVRFVYRGTTSARTVGRDGMNIISFADESMLLGSSVVAATYSFFRSDSGSIVSDEADIILNPAFQYSTSGEANKFDLQGVLTHEIGHLLGLDHAALLSSVMEPFGSVSQLDQRTLSYDDIAGISEIYPNNSAAPVVGEIRGTIDAGSVPVFGAHVVAMDSEGTVLVSTLSQPDGSYILRFLAPGTYRVYAEPLDLPVTEANIGGGPSSFYRNLKTDFGTTYFGGVSTLNEARPVEVTAGAAIVADIQTLPRSTSGLNLTRPVFPLRIPRGARGTLRVAGADLTEGVWFTASSPELVVDAASFGGPVSSSSSTSAAIDSLWVPPLTPLGPKNLEAHRGAGVSIASGALVITEVPPAAVGVEPAAGLVEGGTTVTIAGSNFQPGAQVFFAGLSATDVRVLDSNTIQATAPANVAGAVNVVIVNAGGAWVVLVRSFTYRSQAPAITRVTPLSGPPATAVMIEGDHFDTRAQNVDMRFNGVPARVASATKNTITTIVPFGAATGPISITVFGQTVSGPNFTVTRAVSSTNLAEGAYNFIDASVAGGGANLSFSNTDDAVAFADLPFDFSLFRDIYFAGSKISIATNGYLSLEALAGAEFQNVSLPAQRAARPGGGVAQVPPSLIAPFWDDLVLHADSKVTVRTAGIAPNRQFVVEWSNMSILDEDGRDLNARLTFEAILFEGSNDIQFVYQNMTGHRSDASSATVGAQDQKRTTALQAGFNQAIIFSRGFITYRFQSGTYSAVAPDATPPGRPVVTDGGLLSRSRTELWASWTSEDMESGVREFQYAIGTTPGGAEVRAFASTTQNSVVVNGLNLDVGVTYYFAVKATNNAGLNSETGISDGIRIDPTFQPYVKVIPAIRQENDEFSGIALYAPAAMSVVLKALDSNGTLLSGMGMRNPTTITLSAGQQYARLVSDIFGVQTSDGWIQTEASSPGLGIYIATGSPDMEQLDGWVVGDLSSDFVLFHTNASAILVNPSTHIANATITSVVDATTAQPLSIPPLGWVKTAVSGIQRVQSSEPLAALERFSSNGKLEMNAAVPVPAAQSTLVFPQAVTGGGYVSMLTVANVSSLPQTLMIAFGNSSTTVQIQPNGSIHTSIAGLLQVATDTVRTGAVRVTASAQAPASNFGSLVGILDIENENSMVSIGARVPATETFFAHVAHGNGLLTGLAFAAGDRAANIVVEVYDGAGGPPKSSVIRLAANSDLARPLNQIVPGVTTQTGGYIRIRSDQPIWAWETLYSSRVMASVPPL